MASAIVDYDLQQPPDLPDTWTGYDRPSVVIRWRNCPIARTTVALHDSRLDPVRLHEAIAAASAPQLGQQRLRETLDWSEIEVPDPLPGATVAVCTRDRGEDLNWGTVAWIAV